MGQGFATTVNETNTYKIIRSQAGTGFCIYHRESTMIIGITNERLISEGLKPGSMITHVNDEEVNSVEDYLRLAKRPRFIIRVRSLVESNTFKIALESKNPGIVVDTNLMVSNVENIKDRIHINHRVERVNGVVLKEGDFKKFRELTSDQDTYFITLSLQPLVIPAQTLCNAISTYNQELYVKITSEVDTRFNNLKSWQTLLSNIRTETHQEQVVPTAEHVVSVGGGVIR